MHFIVKLFGILLFATLCSSKKSISIVLDTTLSMRDEIDTIKRNLGAVFSSSDLTDVHKYILVPFKDPEVGPPYNFSSHVELISDLNNLTVSGGQECPENVLSAIENAMVASDPGSQIFVFTDAYAKDEAELRTVQNLCRSYRSQVVIILSGICVPSTSNREVGSVDVYFDVVKACNGSIFQLESYDLFKAFTMMKEIMNTDWSEIKTYSFTTYGDLEFSVDYSTTDLMISVYGKNVSLNVYKSNVNSLRAVTYNASVHTASFIMFRLVELKNGNYKVVIRSTDRISATVYRKNDIPIQIRFSTRRTNILKLTSTRPIPGWNNYIQLIVLPSESPVKLRSLTLYEFKTNKTTQLTLEEDAEYEGQYFSTANFDHDTTFQITVAGEDTSNHLEFTKTIKSMKTQVTLWGQVKEIHSTKPQVEIIPLQPLTQPIDYGITLAFACRVVGYPKPDVSWEEADDLLLEDVSTIEVPHIVARYATISSFRKSRTIRCKANNTYGEDNKSLDLVVNDTVLFEVKNIPKDETIEYGTEGRLYCEVDVYPEATTNWYHNETLLSTFDRPNIELQSENRMILIKSMSLEDAGEYKCEVKNDFETKYYTAKIEISGLEAPQVELESTEIVLQSEDWKEIDCIATGKPTPEISWKYKNNDDFDFGTVPEGVYVDNRKIKISSAKVEHAGTYKCEASNIVGEGTGVVSVKVQCSPIIRNVPESVTVNEGDVVELRCDVDASPNPTVQWETSQGVTLDERYATDDRNTLRFEALWNDSGNYDCVAENSLGKRRKTVAVNVLVPPYIQPPEQINIMTAVGSSVSLVCRVSFGNPLPTTEWHFISTASKKTSLLRSNSTDELILNLSNISKKEEGEYICKAENDLASDSIKIDLRVE